MNQVEFKEKFRALSDLVNLREGWERYQQSLRIHARNEPAEEFIKWSTVQATMFIGNAPHTPTEIRVLRDSDWERWNKLIEDPGIGQPIFSKELPHASGQYIHQCYLLNYIEKKTGIDITQIEQVVEFGAGYGSMRTIFAHAGFEGNYTIFDLPEMLILQEYYLERVLTQEQFSKTALNTTLQLQSIHADLIIGITSVSEMPIETRNKYFDKIVADYYFFVAQPAFFGLSNQDYFKDLIAKNSHLDWDTRSNPLGRPPHEYITGWPKNDVNI